MDDYTLQIKLNHAYPQLLYVLTLPFASPIPQEALDTYADENGNLNEHAIGTGPYVLKLWERGNRIVLEKNPTFHPDFFPSSGNPRFKAEGLFTDIGKTLPFIDRLEIRIIKEQQPAWLNFLSGKIDKMGIPKDQFGSVMTDSVNLSDEIKAKKIQLERSKEASFFYLFF